MLSVIIKPDGQKEKETKESMVCYMAQCKCGTHVGVEKRRKQEQIFKEHQSSQYAKPFVALSDLLAFPSN
jgi:hypothetical protein